MALGWWAGHCSSAANHRACRLLGQQHRPAAACQILYGLACRTDKHAVRQLLLPARSGAGTLVYHRRCIAAPRPVRTLLLLLLLRSAPPQGWHESFPFSAVVYNYLHPHESTRPRVTAKKASVIVSPGRYRAEESTSGSLVVKVT